MTDYEISDEAILLAERANEGYDLRLQAATRLAGVLDTMNSDVFDQDNVEAAEQEFNDADNGFNTYLNAAGVLLSSQVRLEQIDTDIATDTSSDDQPSSMITSDSIGIVEARYSMNSSALARKLGVSHVTVRTAAKELGDALGEVEGFRSSNGRFMPRYNDAQQAMIRQKLEGNGSLTDIASEDVVSAPAIAAELGVDDSFVRKVIESLGDTLGEVNVYRFGKSKTPSLGYTLVQKEQIRAVIESRIAQFEVASEGVIKTTSLAAELGVSDNTVKREIGRLGDRLGEIVTYRFTSVDSSLGIVSGGVTVEQKAMIRQSLEDRGFFAETAPEGVLSGKDLAKSLGVGYGYILQAAKELGSTLGEVKRYTHEGRRIPRPWAGYTSEQQELIRNHRLIKNYLERKAA